MTEFMTEHEIEDLLINETRELILSDGEKQVITADKLFWIRLDLLIDANITTMDDIYRYTFMGMSARKSSFSDAFKSIVIYIDNRVK